MQHKLLATAVGQRTFALIFDTGDDVMAGLEAFAREQGLSGSHFTAIGAFGDATLGYFDWSARRYQPIPVHQRSRCCR